MTVARRGNDRLRRTASAAALVAACVLAPAACNRADGGATSASSSTASPSASPSAAGSTPVPAGPLVGCVNPGPGVVLREAEAIVRFDRSAVCPGYVTVTPGTLVTFTNLDRAPHTVTFTAGLPTRAPGAEPGTASTTAAAADTVTIDADGSYRRRFDALGTTAFSTDALPSFRGVVEVVSSTTPATAG